MQKVINIVKHMIGTTFIFAKFMFSRPVIQFGPCEHGALTRKEAEILVLAINPPKFQAKCREKVGGENLRKRKQILASHAGVQTHIWIKELPTRPPGGLE